MRVEGSVFLLLLGNDALNGLLLFLQRSDHFLLFVLLTLECFAFTFVLRKQGILLSTGLLNLLFLFHYLLLFLLDGFALGTLIVAILPHKAHATEHLCKVVG